MGLGPSLCPIRLSSPNSALTSEPAQKEIVIRVGEGRQHVLDIFSELRREMLVKVVFTLTPGFQTLRLFSSSLLFDMHLAHDNERMGKQMNRRRHRSLDGWVDEWVGEWKKE